MSQNPENVNGGLDPQLGGDRRHDYRANIRAWMETAKAREADPAQRITAIENITELAEMTVGIDVRHAQVYIGTLVELGADTNLGVATTSVRGLLEVCLADTSIPQKPDTECVEDLATLLNVIVGEGRIYPAFAVDDHTYFAENFDWAGIPELPFSVFARLVLNHYPERLLDLVRATRNETKWTSSPRFQAITATLLQDKQLDFYMAHFVRDSESLVARREIGESMCVDFFAALAANFANTPVYDECIMKLNYMALAEGEVTAKTRKEATLSLVELDLNYGSPDEEDE